MEVYGVFLGCCENLRHSHKSGRKCVQAPSLLEQLLKAGQDSPKTLQRCETVMCCQQSWAPCIVWRGEFRDGGTAELQCLQDGVQWAVGACPSCPWAPGSDSFGQKNSAVGCNRRDSGFWALASFNLRYAPACPSQHMPRIPLASAVADLTKDLKEAQVWMTSNSREMKVSIGALSRQLADTCADTQHIQKALGTRFGNRAEHQNWSSSLPTTHF